MNKKNLCGNIVAHRNSIAVLVAVLQELTGSEEH